MGSCLPASLEAYLIPLLHRTIPNPRNYRITGLRSQHTDDPGELPGPCWSKAKWSVLCSTTGLMHVTTHSKLHSVKYVVWHTMTSWLFNYLTLVYHLNLSSSLSTFLELIRWSFWISFLIIIIMCRSVCLQPCHNHYLFFLFSQPFFTHWWNLYW